MKKKTLRVGLTMAGAVSAGAYTAGVMDYLLETLEKWEKAKEHIRNHPKDANLSVPTHDVQICVMGGASAGGMTTAITLALLRESHRPITFEEYTARKNDPEAQKEFAKNKLFDCWVNLTADDMMTQLLSVSDIESIQERNVASMLNSDFINAIAERAFPDKPSDAAAPFPNYFSPETEVILTLTNLQGYEIMYPFKGGGGTKVTYISTTHRDFAHFKLTQSDEDPAKGKIPFRYNDPTSARLIRDAAMATGAFPIGLKHRAFSRKKKYILNNPLINPTCQIAADLKDVQKEDLFRILGQNIGADAPDDFECNQIFVDGGLLNNEPFEVTQHILRTDFCDDPTDKRKEDAEHFDNTIIMIDPFPSETSDYGIQFEPEGVMAIVSKVLSTLRSEPLVKPDNLLKAYSKEDNERFTISPSRDKLNKGLKLEPVAGSMAIACGSLDGFGGFLSKEFREHDFFLGRRNCQSFLRKYFVVKADTENGIFAEGYHRSESRNRFAFQDEASGEWMLPIIPDLSHQGNNQPRAGITTDFPCIQEKETKRIQKLLIGRIKTIARVMRKSGATSYWVAGVLLSMRSKWAARKLAEMMKNSLKGHGVLKG